jgi:transposase
MNKQVSAPQATVFCGIDVSAASLAVALIAPDGSLARREFSNNAGGHEALSVWLKKRDSRVRVSLEATGIYSLDLALALDTEACVELMVLNPKLVNRFAQTLCRSKTDAADAVVLAEYSRRMPFERWQRPAPGHLALRTVSRYIGSLVVEQAALKCRLRGAESTATTPRAVLADLKRGLAAVERRVERLRAEALKLVQADVELDQRYRLLTTVPGVGIVNALTILSELILLAPAMTVRQWVASSGLDPVHRQSGTSLNKPSRISRAGNRRLRAALYMSALSASRYDRHLAAFYRALRARHKTGMQALMAVARKMLHAIYGIFKSAVPYDGRRLFPNIRTEAESIAG